jgi:hypothetical protein
MFLPGSALRTGLMQFMVSGILREYKNIIFSVIERYGGLVVRGLWMVPAEVILMVQVCGWEPWVTRGRGSRSWQRLQPMYGGWPAR